MQRHQLLVQLSVPQAVLFVAMVEFIDGRSDAHHEPTPWQVWLIQSLLVSPLSAKMAHHGPIDLESEPPIIGAKALSNHRCQFLELFHSGTPATPGQASGRTRSPWRFRNVASLDGQSLRPRVFRPIGASSTPAMKAIILPNCLYRHRMYSGRTTVRICFPAGPDLVLS